MAAGGTPSHRWPTGRLRSLKRLWAIAPPNACRPPASRRVLCESVPLCSRAFGSYVVSTARTAADDERAAVVAMGIAVRPAKRFCAAAPPTLAAPASASSALLLCVRSLCERWSATSAGGVVNQEHLLHLQTTAPR